MSIYSYAHMSKHSMQRGPMRNILSYISRATPTPQPQPQPNPIDYRSLLSVQCRLSDPSAPQLFHYPNNKVVQTFQQMMTTLHGLISVISELIQETQRNEEKVKEYDRMRALVGQHGVIVKKVQEEMLESVDRVYQEKRAAEEQLRGQIANLELRLSDTQQEMEKCRAENAQLKAQNQGLVSVVQQLSQQVQKLKRNLQATNTKLQHLTAIEDSSLKFQSKDYSIGDTVTLQTILVYSKLRRAVYNFMGPQQFVNVGLANKQLHYITQKTLKKEYLGILVRSKNGQITEANRKAKEFEKIFDTFPAENIRTNAIKYLFYKIKPGGYILPYFQMEEETAEKLEQNAKSKAKSGSLMSLFKKKLEIDSSKQKVYNFQSLKHDHEFKQVQKRVQTFFDKLFGIQTEEDLRNFNETMKRQLKQLKQQLKNGDRSLQLLCLSKFLYLQINQLNNLLQVCFALLLNKHNDNKAMTKKLDDMCENDKVLRNLVENLASDREKVEKRIFFLENQSMKNKNVQEVLQSELRQIRSAYEDKKQKNTILDCELTVLNNSLKQKQAQIRALNERWQEVLQIFKGIKTIDDDLS